MTSLQVGYVCYLMRHSQGSPSDISSDDVTQ